MHAICRAGTGRARRACSQHALTRPSCATTLQTQLEHILLRPDTYVGSVEPETTETWVYSDVLERMVHREITFVPGMYKIFDEILVNAADNKQRDKSMNSLKVDFDLESGKISVYNNGRGIPVQVHKEHGVYVPELIFGHLLTSSNYNDKQKKTTGGRNGFGAKLTNIFSTEFVVETSDGKLKFKQVFSGNMSSKGQPKISASKSQWTRVTFTPDYKRFGMDGLTLDVVSLLQKRVFDMAGCLGRGVRVMMNGKTLKVRGFKDYARMYVRDKDEELPLIYERVHPRWEVAVSTTDGHFQQVSFVNSINTMKGGQHVNCVTDQITKKLLKTVKAKHEGLAVKAHHIKNHLWIFVNCLIENPAFDSQTKMTLTTRKSSFGSKCEISDKFAKAVLKSGVMKRVLSWAQFRQARQLKKSDGKRTGRIAGIPKLSDANNAGTRKGKDCTLILTEGDSAKALALSGLSVVGRDNYGVFPLKGKLLNVRDASMKQILNNNEISNLKKIIGLEQGKRYEDVSSLRYGRVMIMADQDHDGSHIKGLVINLFSYFWPSLFKMTGFLVEFITPIVKCSRGPRQVQFFTFPEYEAWKGDNDEGRGWKIKYYKGLGTSTPAEAKEYFSDLERHIIDFRYDDEKDDDAINMVFSKKLAARRKTWLQDFKMGTFLAQENIQFLRYKDFVNKELILFSMESNVRAIPSLVDGLKPGQRKILYACFKRNLNKEIKVAQLAGYVSEHSAYHHGEASLNSTICKMAQNYVGSNNINLLMPQGQFGTRYEGGKDVASPRYIFTYLSPITRAIFCPNDDNILSYTNEDGQWVEPQYYVPVLPMVLVNGSSGMGTGWSTNVPNYDPRAICANIVRFLDGYELDEMTPFYKGFTGEIARKNATSYAVRGVIEELDDVSLRVTELPVGHWTQGYKTFLEDLIAKGHVKSFKEYHTDNTVNFEVTMASADKLREYERAGLRKKLKLDGSVSTSNLVLFDEEGKLRKYSGAKHILNDFCEVRLEYYERRKDYMIETLANDVSRLSNKVRFIRAVIEGDFVIQNKKKSVILEELAGAGYRAFPRNRKRSAGGAADDDDGDESKASNATYEYLLSMQLWSLTHEKIATLEAELDEKRSDLEELERTTPRELWKRDIDHFLEMLDEHEARETAAAHNDTKLRKKAARGASKKSRKPKRSAWDGGSDDDYDPDAGSSRRRKKTAAVAKPKPRRKPVSVPKAAEIPIPRSALSGFASRKKATDAKRRPFSRIGGGDAKVAPRSPEPVPTVKAEPDSPLPLSERLNMRMMMDSPSPAPKPKPKAKAGGRKGRRATKRVVYAESSDEEFEMSDSDGDAFRDDESDDAYEPTPKPKRSRKKTTAARKKPAAAKPKPKATRKKAAPKKSEFDFDDDEDFAPDAKANSRPAAKSRRKPATSKRSKPKKAASAKSPAVTPKPKRRRMKVDSPAVDSFEPVREEESEAEVSEASPPPRARRARRAVKSVCYAESSASEDEVAEESESDASFHDDDDDSDYEDY